MYVAHFIVDEGDTDAVQLENNMLLVDTKGEVDANELPSSSSVDGMDEDIGETSL